MRLVGRAPDGEATSEGSSLHQRETGLLSVSFSVSVTPYPLCFFRARLVAVHMVSIQTFRPIWWSREKEKGGRGWRENDWSVESLGVFVQGSFKFGPYPVGGFF